MESWPRTPDGELAMVTQRLDLQGQRAEARVPPAHDAAPKDTGPRDP